MAPCGGGYRQLTPAIFMDLIAGASMEIVRLETGHLTLIDIPASDWFKVMNPDVEAAETPRIPFEPFRQKMLDELAAGLLPKS